MHGVEVPSTNSLDSASCSIRHPLNNVISAVDSGYLDALVSHDVEPLFGATEEFSEYCDLVLMSGPVVSPLFPDTPDEIQVDDVIATFAYNGLPNQQAMEKIFSAIYKKSPKKPTYQYGSSLFFGYGKKSVSFGKILAVGDGIVAYDCSLLSGASGAFFKAVNSPDLLYSGLHEGGDFDQKSQTAYNYGYLCSHKAIVLIYAKYIYPAFSAHGIVPEPLVRYLKHYSPIILAHLPFINAENDTNIEALLSQ